MWHKKLRVDMPDSGRAPNRPVPATAPASPAAWNRAATKYAPCEIIGRTVWFIPTLNTRSISRSATMRPYLSTRNGKQNDEKIPNKKTPPESGRTADGGTKMPGTRGCVKEKEASGRQIAQGRT